MARMRVLRKTKLIATIGPSSDSLETLKAMIRAGMNVARLNFSHGSHEEHRKRLETIRQAAAELDANVGIMLDTKGVEIRTQRVSGGSVHLTTGEPFSLYTESRPGNAEGVSVTYPTLCDEVSVGSTILLDDGVIELRVQSIRPHEICCLVTRGGRLGDRKGVNLPGESLARRGISAEDHEDLLFAIDSIPAVIAVTRDTFLAFSSNAFAILGLRSLYFAIAPLIRRFRLLKLSLIVILAFVGMKMLLTHHYPIPTAASLCVILVILTVGIGASVLGAKHGPAAGAPLEEGELDQLVRVSLRGARRIAIALIGSTALLLGIALLILPGPGLLVIPIGLAILSTEFVWARRWLAKIRDTAAINRRSGTAAVGSAPIESE